MSDRHYHHGDLRNALITQGLALLEEQGLAGLSLRAIAARGNDAALAEIRREVIGLLDRFPLYEFL